MNGYRSELVLTREQCRRVDRYAIDVLGIPGLVLMENAGRGVVEGLCRHGFGGPWLICCGRGNNAGDGFVIARHAAIRGIYATTLLFTEPERLSGDAAANFGILQRMELPLMVCGDRFDAGVFDRFATDAAVVIDALLGTGAVGAPRPPFSEVIRQMNACAAPVVAVDIPSGLDCDTGEALGETVVARYTFTFVANKQGFLAPEADRYTGEVVVCDIGLPKDVILRAIENPGGDRVAPDAF